MQTPLTQSTQGEQNIAKTCYTGVEMSLLNTGTVMMVISMQET
jgi:hypothetical protein